MSICFVVGLFEAISQRSFDAALSLSAVVQSAHGQRRRPKRFYNLTLALSKGPFK